MVSVSYKVCQVTIDDKYPWCVSSYDACQVTMKQTYLNQIWGMECFDIPTLSRKFVKFYSLEPSQYTPQNLGNFVLMPKIDVKHSLILILRNEM